MSEQLFIQSHMRHLNCKPWTLIDKRNYRLIMGENCKQEQRVMWFVTGIEYDVFSLDDYFGKDDALVRDTLLKRKMLKSEIH